MFFSLSVVSVPIVVLLLGGPQANTLQLYWVLSIIGSFSGHH